MGVLDLSTPFFWFAVLPRCESRREPGHEARPQTPGPTCQAAECAGSWGGKLAIHNHRKGGLQMAKKAKGGKKKAAKKR